jgi:sugar phosphate isomerase/epimerase
MRTISRRQLLGGAAAATAGFVSTRALRADPLGMPIGVQTWIVRDAIQKDFPGTLKMLADSGFGAIEMCSPPGYGWTSLANMTASRMRATIEAAGLHCESCHFQFQELRRNLDDRIAFAKELGLTQMILSTFGLPNTATMADWLGAAAELNAIGEKVQKAGIQLGFHNHDFEFREIGGALVYDKLMGAFDPKLIRMQFQVAVISLGYQALTYLQKYPGRFISLHLADYAPAEKKQVPLGQGAVNWPELFAAAEPAGVKNYFVEMDLDLMKDSIPYLHSLTV